MRNDTGGCCTQSEQVAQLWPVLFEHCKLEVVSAYRTFAWNSDARCKVHVVILGLDHREVVRSEKRLFSYPDINSEPEESTPTNGMGRLMIGTQLLEVRLRTRACRAPIQAL